MDRRRVVLVVFPPSGGLFQFAFQLGEQMAHEGGDVHLVTGWRPELSPRRGLQLHPVLPTWHPTGSRSGTSSTIRTARRAWRAVRLLMAWLTLIPRLLLLRPDVVLWSEWRFEMDAAFVVLIGRLLRRTTFGIIAHEPVASYTRNTAAVKSSPVFDRLLVAAWGTMDVAMVLGEETRRALMERWRPSIPVVVIPHGDERSLRRDGPLTPASETAPVVLFFGTWTAYKGIDMLFEAFALVREQVTSAKLVVAGAVSDDVDLDEIATRAREIGSVELRPGYVATDDVHDLVSSARLLVTPYTWASQSGVVHLAYTFERPVVTTDVGDVASVVQDGVSGFVTCPGDAAEFARRVVQLLNDPALAEEQGREGHALLMASSSWRVVAEKVGDALDMVSTYRPRGG